MNRWMKEKGFYVVVESRINHQDTKAPRRQDARKKPQMHADKRGFTSVHQRRGCATLRSSAVPESRAAVIGLAKYTELSPGEFWLEGLRVDPQRRSKGLGWKVSRFILKEVLKERPRSLRLATGRRNRHSRRIIRKMGLRLKLALWGYDSRIPRTKDSSPPRHQGTKRTRARNSPGSPETFIPDPQAAFNYLRKTEEFKAGKGLLQHTWQFRTITRELLEDLVREKRVFGYGSNENLQGLLILQPGRYENGRLDISFIEGTRKAIGEFPKQIRRTAREWKCRSMAGMARGDSMLRHLRGLRMKRWRRPGKLPPVLVYEYPQRK
jgi:GNAT superfamily N-acetyltransferase